MFSCWGVIRVCVRRRVIDKWEMGNFMENLQPVLDVVIASFQIDTMLLIQGIVIALVLGFMMSGLGQIIYYILAALVLDLIVVPLGMAIYANEMNFGGAGEYFGTISEAIMADPVAILSARAIFFALTLLAVRLVSSMIRSS